MSTGGNVYLPAQQTIEIIDCTDIQINTNDTGTFTVSATTPTLLDSEGLLRAIYNHYGKEKFYRILNNEIEECSQ